MTGICRRVAAIGLCVLLIGGAHGPIAYAASTTGSNPTTPETTTAGPNGPDTTTAGPTTAIFSGPPVSNVSGPPVPTASTSYSLVASPFSLTISPTRLIVNAANLAKVQQILVVNRGQASVSVAVQKRNFTPDADGTLTFVASTAYAAADWVTVAPPTLDLAPGASQAVTLTVKVPANADLGDHEVAVVFLVAAGKTSGNIKINRGVAAPMYVTVPGPIDTSATISDLAAPGFVDGGPVTITAKVTNTGTVHRDFRGLTPLRITAPGRAAAFPDFTVLRGATRDISTTWNPPLICICHPTVSIVNADGKAQSVTVRVIVFPVRLAIAVLFVALLLILLFVFGRRRHRTRAGLAATAMHRRSSGGDV